LLLIFLNITILSFYKNLKVNKKKFYDLNTIKYISFNFICYQNLIIKLKIKLNIINKDNHFFNENCYIISKLSKNVEDNIIVIY
jgi:hypothetical protein